jgi:hypothetical protein
MRTHKFIALLIVLLLAPSVLTVLALRFPPSMCRCMKPNDLKKASTFQAGMMLAQLRYAGLLEVCRIRQIGYPVRKSFEEFVFRWVPPPPYPHIPMHRPGGRVWG